MECIPKIIHYCWFGRGEKSSIIQKCIQSWEKFLPDYQIIEWNEDNYNVNQLKYTKQAYEAGMYAFVSDYVRLRVLKQYGGIYLDTDVEVLQPLNRFLTNHFFLGFESDQAVAPGLIMGSEKGHPFLDELMEYYESHDFVNTYTTVHNATNILGQYGLVLDTGLKQVIHGITIYPKKIFCPDENVRSNRTYTEETYTAHHYLATWRKQSFNQKLRNPMWRCVFVIIAYAGMFSKTLFGKRRWTHIRDRYLRRLYNFVRGV